MYEKRSKRTNSGLGGRPNRTIRHDKPDSTEDIFLDDDDDDELPMEPEGDPMDDIREAIRLVLVGKTNMIGVWLENIGAKNPARALSLYKDLTEFCVPKLQRTDSKSNPTSPVQVNFESVSSYEQRKAEEKHVVAEEQQKVPPVTRTVSVPVNPKYKSDGFL